MSLALRILENSFYSPWLCGQCPWSWTCAHRSRKFSMTHINTHHTLMCTDAAAKKVLMNYVSGQLSTALSYFKIFIFTSYLPGSFRFNATFCVCVWLLSLHNSCTDFRVYAGFPWPCPCPWWPSPWRVHMCRVAGNTVWYHVAGDVP